MQGIYKGHQLYIWCFPYKDVLSYMLKIIHTLYHTQNMYTLKVSVMFRYVDFDMVYIYNYDIMSFLNTYITRIHIKSMIHILDITICHTLTYMHNHTYKHSQTIKIV